MATYHRPLVGTFSKGISELINPRLQRLREKVSGYQFTVTYVPGKTHNIADALSRAPIFPGSDDLDLDLFIYQSSHSIIHHRRRDTNYNELQA